MTNGNTIGDARSPKQASLTGPDSTGRAAGQAQAFKPSGEKGKRPPSPRNCREFIRRETANAMPDIVTTFVGKAREGSVPHFTSLAKIGGLDQRPTAEDSAKPRRRSLGRQLLDEVEKYEARQAAELAQAGGPASRRANQIDKPRPQERS